MSRARTFGWNYLRDAVGHGVRGDALDVGERIGELLGGRGEHGALGHRRRGDPPDVLHARLERALKIGVVESGVVVEFCRCADGPLGPAPRRGLRGHRAPVRGHHTFPFAPLLLTWPGKRSPVRAHESLAATYRGPTAPTRTTMTRRTEFFHHVDHRDRAARGDHRGAPRGCRRCPPA